MSGKRAPTIRDVATQAGVSTATVSKYINGVQHFTPEVEKRLDEVIARLGYRLNQQARSMVTGRTRCFGVAVQDVCNPHFANIIKGANRVALEQDYSLLVVDVQEREEYERHVLQALSGRVDGMIVSSRLPDESLRWLEELGKPVVFFGRRDVAGARCVRTDGRRGACMLARHLLETGRRNLVYLGFPGARWDAERLAGIREALAGTGVEVRSFAAESPDMEGGQRAASGILMTGARPDGVIAYNDLLAIGFMYSARTLGVQVPQEVAVTGFDDIPVAAYLNPALTTINMRGEEQGETAMWLLLDAISKEPRRPRDILFEPLLVPRHSTARQI